MELDERLQQLADQVRSLPPGDASALYRQGIRRRRWRQVGRATAVLVAVGMLGVGIASLMDRPARLEIADQPFASRSAAPDDAEVATPPGGGPLIAQPPALTVSSDEPFAWAVAVSATEDGRWCAFAVRGTTEISDTAGQPCHQPAAPPEGDFSWHGSQPDSSPGATAEGLSWGLAPAGTDKMAVEFTDGSRGRAQLAADETVDVVLWAIAYENVDIQEIQAFGNGVDTGTVVLEGFDVLDLLQLLGWLVAFAAVLGAARWLIRRRRH